MWDSGQKIRKRLQLQISIVRSKSVKGDVTSFPDDFGGTIILPATDEIQ